MVTEERGVYDCFQFNVETRSRLEPIRSGARKIEEKEKEKNDLPTALTGQSPY